MSELCPNGLIVLVAQIVGLIFVAIPNEGKIRNYDLINTSIFNVKNRQIGFTTKNSIIEFK